MIKRLSLRNLQSDIYFIISIVAIFFIYGYNHTTKLGSYSVHQWRQSDCLSITSNYYEEDLNFLETKINWCGKHGVRNVISEFPIIYFFVAKLWKIFGKEPGIYRLMNLIIFSFGLFALYKICQKLLLSNFWAIILTLFLFTSPLLAYYANNFIMNTTAFSLVLIGLYFNIYYYKNTKVKYLLYGNLFYLIAALLKVTALLSFTGLLPIHYYLLFRKRVTNKKIAHYCSPIIVLILVFSWYYYAHQYNQSNLQGIFLQGILPFWDLNFLQFKNILILLYHNLLPNYFSHGVFFFIILAFIYSALNFKKTNKLLFVLCLNCIIGSISYILLFFQVFNVHDYYLINLLVVPPIIILQFFVLLKRINSEILNSKSLKAISLIVLVALIYNAAVLTRVKYKSHDRMVKYSFILDNQAKNHWSSYHWKYKNTFKKLETIEPYLRDLGINRHDKVISMPDYSINITLSLMNQIGFTDFGFNELKGEERIEHFIDLGAKYLIINDSTLKKEKYLKPYLQNHFGQYENIDIYQL